MDLIPWLTIGAIFLGPVVAVQLTRYLDDKNEKRERKLRVFKTLMATRGMALSWPHVEALNLIDLEFSIKKSTEKEVIDAWKAYLDHLCDQTKSPEQWNIRRIDLLIDLLHKMSIVLNYQFDKTHIKNAAYSPRAHGELEDDQTAIRRGLRELLEAKRVIPMFVTNLPPQVENDDRLEQSQ